MDLEDNDSTVSDDEVEPLSFRARTARVLALLAVLSTMSHLGVWRAAPYVVTGVLLWLATLESGLHASIAGMLI